MGTVLLNSDDGGEDMPFIPATPATLTVFDSCGVQNWFPAISGVPYTNSGDNTAGFVDVTGNGLAAVVGGVLDVNFDGFANAFPVVAGDFTLTLQSQELAVSAWSSAIIFTDKNHARTLTFFYGDPDGLRSLYGTAKNCNGIYGDNLFLAPGGYLALNTWHTISLRHAGGLFTLSVNGTIVQSFESVIPVYGRPGIAHIGGGSHHQWRNITLT